MNTHIRWMIRRDLPEVRAIEDASFQYTWVEEDFLRCMRNRSQIGMIAERNDKVVGFMFYELCRSRLRLLNFAVHPDFRRSGVGTALIQKLAAKLSSHRRNRITLEVRETNLPAQFFFSSQGFRALRVLPGFYADDSGEDAYRMVYKVERNEPSLVSLPEAG